MAFQHQRRRRMRLLLLVQLAVLCLLVVVVGLSLSMKMHQQQQHDDNGVGLKKNSAWDDINVVHYGRRKRLPVYLFPPDRGNDSGQGEVGIRHSRRLVEAEDPDMDGVVWASSLTGLDCNQLITKVQESMQIRKRRKRKWYAAPFSNSNNNITWPIFVYDIYDRSKPSVVSCIKRLSDMVGHDNIRYARRKYDSQSRFLSLFLYGATTTARRRRRILSCIVIVSMFLPSDVTATTVWW